MHKTEIIQPPLLLRRKGRGAEAVKLKDHKAIICGDNLTYKSHIWPLSNLQTGYSWMHKQSMEITHSFSRRSTIEHWNGKTLRSWHHCLKWCQELRLHQPMRGHHDQGQTLLAHPPQDRQNQFHLGKGIEQSPGPWVHQHIHPQGSITVCYGEE